jgi:RNA polymerase sigma-70 factor (ECF subfamily)
MRNEGQQAPVAGIHASFQPTDWKTVIDAGGDSSAAAVPALRRLCETYWYPLYAHVRRCGLGAHDAEDLTQGFFAFLLGSEGLKTVDRARGRFRSFLLAAINHFLSNERDRQNAIKRGGKTVILSWDAVEAEQRYGQEPVDSASPDVLFARSWAKALVERVSARLSSEYRGRRQEQTFVALEKFLTCDVDQGEYAVIAPELGMTEGAIRTAVTRLRERFGRLLRAELSRTISDPSELNDELRHIIEALVRD